MWADVRAALSVELIKARRSWVPRVSLAAMLLAGAVDGFFLFVVQDPDRARRFGLLGDKAQLAGATADWDGAVVLTAQIAAVGGLLTFGVVAIWLFGREFADGTAKDLLALPTPRHAVVVAKLVLGWAWSVALTGVLTACALVAGLALGLPGGSAGDVARGALLVLAVGALTGAGASVFALAASLGRGYLPGFGALFACLVAAQVLSAVGHGTWFPWAVPGLLAGSAGPEQVPGAGPVVGLLVVAVASAVVHARWWERADHAR